MAVHPVVSIAILPFQRCIGGLLTQNRHGERSIRRLVNSAGFSRFRAGSRRAIGIPPTKSGGGGFLCLGVVQHGPGLPTNVFLNRISRVLAGGGYCRLWGVSRFWRKWLATTIVSASPLGRSVQNPLESPGGPGIPRRLSRIGRFVPAAAAEFRSRLRIPQRQNKVGAGGLPIIDWR